MSVFKTLQHEFAPSKVLSLEAFRACLQALGNPHLSLPPQFHIAGTNGKGSTVATLNALYQQAGYKVHAFTSPHLLCVTERIQIANTRVSLRVLEETILSYKALFHAHHLSWFEVLTATAFLLFSRYEADLVLLETGLGGEFDATNVIASPIAALFTAISYDHMDRLGHTLTDIARTKAKIIKSGTTVISVAQPAAAQVEIIKAARQYHITPRFQELDWHFRRDRHQTCFQINGTEMNLPQPSLLGDHQLQNVGLALAALHSAQTLFPVAEQAIAKGLQTIRWPGRLQLLGTQGQRKIWYDVAHNEAGIKAITHYFDQQPQKTIFLLALPKGKDIPAILKALNTACHEFIFFQPQDKAHFALPQGNEPYPSLEQALSLAKAGQGENIVILGSHYFAAELQPLEGCLLL